MQLRKMTMQDADKMLEWKNYPETREYAIATHDEIKKADHYKWLEQNLQYFQVIPNISGGVIGFIRIENNEISIWLDREYWGKGIASFYLEEISEKGMFCKIVDGNISSFRSFLNAGFKPIAHEHNYYILEK